MAIEPVEPVEPSEPAATAERAEPVGSIQGSLDGVVNRDDFRRVCGRFATGIAIAATSDRGVDYAMTVSAFTSVSLDPLLVLVCVEKITRFHEAVMASGAWTISVLPEDAESVSRWFAEKGRPTKGQFADHVHHPGAVTGMPVLDIATAVIECRTTDVHDGGDHDIVVGEVVGVWADPAHRRPLLYVDGKYRKLDDQPGSIRSANTRVE